MGTENLLINPRPEFIGSFLEQTEFPDALRDRVQTRRMSQEISHGEKISRIQALAYLFIEIGSQTIYTINSEQSPGSSYLHPNSIGTFQTLPIEDQESIRQAYASVILGVSVLTLTEMMERGDLLYAQDWFVSLYNTALAGCLLPTIKADVDMKSKRFRYSVNEDGHEIINDSNPLRDSGIFNGLIQLQTPYERIKKYYNEKGIADFLTNNMWDCLPLSLQAFIDNNGGIKLQHDIANLQAQFHKRAEILIKDRINEIPVIFRVAFNDPNAISLDPNRE